MNTRTRRNQPRNQQEYRLTWLGRFRRWLEAHPLRGIAVISAILTFVAITILQEIANRIVDTEIFPWLGVTVRFYRWILFGLLLLPLVTGVMLWQQSLHITRLQALSTDSSPAGTHKRMKDAEGQRALFGAYLNTSVEVLETMIAYLATISWEEGDLDHLRKLLIPIVLKRVQRMYAHQLVPYASVYTRSALNPDYLTIYSSVNVNAERVERNRWYVGEDRRRQRAEGGTAGKVFLSKKPIVHHINPDTNLAEEGSDYIASRSHSDLALYLSFVAIPLVHDGQCLGVLCLDSSARDTFDGDPGQVILEPAAKLLAELLKIRHG